MVLQYHSLLQCVYHYCSSSVVEHKIVLVHQSFAQFNVSIVLVHQSFTQFNASVVLVHSVSVSMPSLAQ